MHTDSHHPVHLPDLELEVEIGLLGAVSTKVDGGLVAIPGGRARALLVSLALRPGRSRSVAALVEDVWPDAPPRSPKNALQTQISRLRAALPPGLVQSGPAGYRLDIDACQVDLTRAEALVVSVRESLETAEYADATSAVDGARALWRGEPGADLADSPLADELRRRAHSATVELDRLEIRARIGLRDFIGVLPLLTRVHHHDPVDEQVAGDLMRCLHALGRTNDALAVFAEVRRMLAARLGTDPSPQLADLNATLLVPQAKRPMSIGLRAAPNALIGRGADIDAIEAAMSSSRVTTVLGPGGSGKTRIAHELGLRASASRPVAFVELAALRRGEDVASAITSTLGLSETDAKLGGIGIARVHTARERLREVLSQAPGLLVLDNCEHLIDDVARIVDELVSASDHLTVLITSRSPLSITSEAVYHLPPLRIDGQDSSAVELFVARATAVRPGAAFDVREVVRLCRTLDGLPLAIELAAARARTLSVADINSRLEHRFALLRSTDRTRPERHRTLHAVIDWSWTLLSDEQRAVLARLCRFPAGFTADAAEAVAGLDEHTDVADALDGLVGQSLLTVTDEGDHVRYHMLETVREFGEEKLPERDALDVNARMILWGTGITRSVKQWYSAGRQIDAIGTVEAEHDNLVDVLRLALTLGRQSEVFAIFGVLAFFWSMRGAHTEVLNWVERVEEAMPKTGGAADDIDEDCRVVAQLVMLAHVGYTGDTRGAARMRSRLRRALRTSPGIDPGLSFIGQTLVARSDGRGLGRSLALGTRSEHASVRNAAFMIRSSLQENYGNLVEAANDAEHAKAIAHARGDAWSESTAAQALGSIHGQSGQFDPAIDNYTKAADLMWEMHAFDESVQARVFVGASLIASGRIGEGRAVLTEIAEMASGSEGTLSSEAEFEGQRMAAIGAARAEADLAEGYVEEGLALYRRSIDASGFAGGHQDDPFVGMLASAAVGAHALHGATEKIHSVAEGLVDAVSMRGGPSGFQDLPQMGAVACALGSYFVQSGRDPQRGLGLIVLAGKVKARQDYPSMRVQSHVSAATNVLGAAAIEDETNRHASTTRAGALAEIHELLRS